VSTKIQYSSKQDRANWISHFIGILFFVPAGFLLINRGIRYIDKTNFNTPTLLLVALTAMSVFVLMIYTSSTIYHVSNPFNRAKWKTFDHIAIFWGIAGTYLPFIVINYNETGSKFWLFPFMIILALIGTALKLFFPKIPNLMYVAIYLMMGWVIVFFGKNFIDLIPPTAMKLVILGGVSYTIGVIFYISKRLYYSHAIWHVFVLIGSISHYFAVWSMLSASN